MKLIRYAIRKDDLHNLLHAIGVLQEEERLLAVNNIDLTETENEVVIVTVSTEPGRSLPKEHEHWTDKEIQQRYAELTIIEDSATQQLRAAVEEMRQLKQEREKRSMSIELGSDGIPGTVEMNIRDQLRKLLGGGEG